MICRSGFSRDQDVTYPCRSSAGGSEVMKDAKRRNYELQPLRVFGRDLFSECLARPLDPVLRPGLQFFKRLNLTQAALEPPAVCDLDV